MNGNLSKQKQKTLKGEQSYICQSGKFTLVAIQQYSETGAKTFNHYAPHWQFVVQQESKNKYDGPLAIFDLKWNFIKIWFSQKVWLFI